MSVWLSVLGQHLDSGKQLTVVLKNHLVVDQAALATLMYPHRLTIVQNQLPLCLKWRHEFVAAGDWAQER